VEKEANCCCVWVWNERSENRNGIERNGWEGYCWVFVRK
jgi:hypothetical protein